MQVIEQKRKDLPSLKMMEGYDRFKGVREEKEFRKNRLEVTLVTQGRSALKWVWRRKDKQALPKNSPQEQRESSEDVRVQSAQHLNPAIDETVGKESHFGGKEIFFVMCST